MELNHYLIPFPLYKKGKYYTIKEIIFYYINVKIATIEPEKNNWILDKGFIINKLDGNSETTQFSYLDEFFSNRKAKLLKLKECGPTM